MTHKIPLDGRSTRFLLLARAIFEHVVHLLQSPAAGFRNEKVRPYKGQQAEHRKEDIGAITCILNQGRRNQSNYEVVEPIGAG